MQLHIPVMCDALSAVKKTGGHRAQLSVLDGNTEELVKYREHPHLFMISTNRSLPMRIMMQLHSTDPKTMVPSPMLQLIWLHIHFSDMSYMTCQHRQLAVREKQYRAGSTRFNKPPS